MKVTVSFRHLEHTPALDERIHEKSEKIAKYLDGNLHLKWSCEVRDGREHYAEIEVLGPGFDFHAEAHSENLYKTIDLAVAKIEKQVQKKKEKMRNRKKMPHKDIEILDPESAWLEHESDIDDMAS
ncbi:MULTISPECIES: ribosome hibernation-promoting factor, HPF/YfiA family [unclassified Halobacteriovorax]|uniref:ribosome hibernation-promoting factor, HPF/YfiA family n=1 Tax=unclassified Halobacteriovorax TaxID=2639665 RepID=UPI002FF30E7D